MYVHTIYYSFMDKNYHDVYKAKNRVYIHIHNPPLSKRTEIDGRKNHMWTATLFFSPLDFDEVAHEFGIEKGDIS